MILNGFKVSAFIEFEVILDYPWENERTIYLKLDEYEIIPINCENEIEYLYKHISPANLKRFVRGLAIDKPTFKLGLIITRRS